MKRGTENDTICLPLDECNRWKAFGKGFCRPGNDELGPLYQPIICNPDLLKRLPPWESNQHRFIQTKSHDNWTKETILISLICF